MLRLRKLEHRSSSDKDRYRGGCKLLNVRVHVRNDQTHELGTDIGDDFPNAQDGLVDHCATLSLVLLKIEVIENCRILPSPARGFVALFTLIELIFTLDICIKTLEEHSNFMWLYLLDLCL
ncbi:hypothetical protein T01_11745 [Trichinella spiralis]|uniref:Uncharacterized protein n=1 Tax=Trichinella spiralis TaxID=6334 RepID=A0A0V1ANW9_TRISP|nr:hypothetical protein T01_11745 [Trichinella spiralis]